VKNAAKAKRPAANGRVPTRRELIAAHERWLRRERKMTKREGFDALLRAGIITSQGKLARRYGG